MLKLGFLIALLMPWSALGEQSAKLTQDIVLSGANEKQAQELAIKIIYVAHKHNLDPGLLAAIVRVESMYKVGAFNARTRDYGLMQINERTAAAYGFSLSRLSTDADYNLNAGAKVLAYFNKRYAHKESMWYCRYNVGTAALKRINKKCLMYASLVHKAMLKQDLPATSSEGSVYAQYKD